MRPAPTVSKSRSGGALGRSPSTSRNDADEDDRYDREVDEEHPPPAHLGGEHAAEDHSGSARHGAHAAPGAERFDPVAAGVKGRRQDGKRRGRHHRRADPLNQPAPISTPSLPARPHTSDEIPNSDVPATSRRRRPSRSASAAAEQQEPAVGEQVRARDPLQALDREVQMSRICGSATFTMDASRRSMNATAHSRARVSLPRRVPRKDGGADVADRVSTGEDRPKLLAEPMAPNAT